MRHGFIALCLLMCPSVAVVAVADDDPDCLDDFETTAFGVEIEIEDKGLLGLNLEMKLDGEEWEMPGSLTRSLDWSTIEDYGTPACPEDSDCDLRVKFILGRLTPTSQGGAVDKSGDPYEVVEFDCD